MSLEDLRNIPQTTSLRRCRDHHCAMVFFRHREKGCLCFPGFRERYSNEAAGDKLPQFPFFLLSKKWSENERIIYAVMVLWDGWFNDTWYLRTSPHEVSSLVFFGWSKKEFKFWKLRVDLGRKKGCQSCKTYLPDLQTVINNLATWVFMY